jgi:hypothetical protein
MLESNGWTLNRQGNAYNAQTDDVRCKLVNGQLVALDLKMLVTEENHFADALREVVGKALAEAGIGLTVEEMPMQEVLRYYYRQAERDCDMIFMASNFDVVFDPSVNFRPDSKDVNHYNTTAIQDPTLYALALDMRQECIRRRSLPSRMSTLIQPKRQRTITTITRYLKHSGRRG